MSWCSVAPGGESAPLPRFEHAVCAWQSGALLHGGRTDTSAVFSDFFALSLNGVSPMWTKMELAHLPARYGHAMAIIGTTVILFGGRNQDHNASDLLFTVDLQTKQVTRIEADGTNPSARHSHSMVVLSSSSLVIFGGLGQDEKPLNDLFVLRISEDGSPVWSSPPLLGDLPSPRHTSLSWYHASKLYLFGGHAEGGLVSDMYQLECDSWTWTKVVQDGKIPPATQRYHGVICGGKMVTMGEKGPLRMYSLNLAQQKAAWETSKASGALPSFAGFGLVEGAGSLYIIGGHPFRGKESEISLWALDLSTVNNPLELETSPSLAFQTTTSEKPDRSSNKYGTLRSMFRKERGENKDKEQKMSPLKAKTLRGSKHDTSGGEDSKSPKSPHSRQSSDGYATLGRHSLKMESPNLRRADSMSRFSGTLTPGSASSEDKGARSPARSPTSSPGRNKNESYQDELLHISLAEATSAMERMKRELEIEKKKNVALQAGLDQVTGQGDASQLVRKALDEEVKRSAALRARVDALEKEQASMQQEKLMLSSQASRFKALIAEQTKQVVELEGQLATQTEALSEAEAKISKMQGKVAQVKKISSRYEEERLEKSIADLRLRGREGMAREMLSLLSFARSELDDLTERYLDGIEDGDDRESEAFRLQTTRDLLSLNQERYLMAANAPARTGEVTTSASVGDANATNESSDTRERSDSFENSGESSPSSGGTPVMPRLLIQQQKSVPSNASSPRAPASPKSPRYQILLKELAFRNTLETPLSYPAPQHLLVRELRTALDRFRQRIKPTDGDARALCNLACKLEREFLSDLQLIQSSVIDPLTDNGILSADQITTIFGNWSAMLSHQADFVEALLTCSGDVHALLATYSQNARDILELHDTYAENLGFALAKFEGAKSRSSRLQRFLLILRQNPTRILDVPSWLIKPLIHLSWLADLFSAFAGVTCGVEGDDVGSVTDNATVLFRQIMVPVEMLQEKLQLTCSNAKLRALELSDDTDLVGHNGRMYITDVEVVTVETTNGESRDAYSACLTLCNDILIVSKRTHGRMLLHDLIPLSLLSLVTNDATSLNLTNKSKSGTAFLMHFSSHVQTRHWEDLLRASAEAASLFYQGKTQSSEEALSSSSSGWRHVDLGEMATPSAKLEDTDDICYTKDPLSGRATVRGGKPAALVQWLVHDISGPSAGEEVAQFLQACHALVPPAIILEKALSLFDEAENSLQKRRVLNFLALWSLEFGSRDLLANEGLPAEGERFWILYDFVKRCSQEAAVDLRDALNSVKLGLLRCHAFAVQARMRKQSRPESMKLEFERADLEMLPPATFAEQLTLAVHGHLSGLTDKDLYEGDKAPKVQQMITFWNELSEWCVAFFGQGTDEVASALRLKKLLLIAKRCLELKNYDSAFAIGLALDSSRAFRSALESLGRAEQEVVDSLNYVTNVSKGFSNYRTLTASLEPPACPYLAIALKDVVLIRENDSYIEKSELINYRKMVILGSRLRFFRRYRDAPYRNLKPVQTIQNAFRTLPSATKEMKERPVVEAPTLASQMGLQEHKNISSKFQTLKKSVLATPFFTPRDSSTAAPLSPGESRRAAFTARASRKMSPRVDVFEGKEDSLAQRRQSVTEAPSPPPLAGKDLIPKKQSLGGGETTSSWNRALPRAVPTEKRGSLQLARKTSGNVASADHSTVVSEELDGQADSAPEAVGMSVSEGPSECKAEVPGELEEQEVDDEEGEMSYSSSSNLSDEEEED